MHDSHDHEHERSHEHSHEHQNEHAPHRSLSAILKIIEAAPLHERVKQRRRAHSSCWARRRAAIHSIPIEKVHFHEVGAVDTIVDIVCAAAGCEALGVDRWMASPLECGQRNGEVRARHAACACAGDAGAAGRCAGVCGGPPMERVTPTGAALLRMLDVSYGTLPAMRVEARGYGAGGRDTPGEPNLLRLLVGEADRCDAEGVGADRGD